MHVSTPKSWRGGEQQLAYLYEELNTLGIAQHILCARGSKMEAYCKQNNYPHTTQHKRSAVSSLFAKAVKQVCRQTGANIIHTHDSHAHTFAVMSASLYGNKVPIVVSRRVDFPVSSSPLSRLKYNHKSVKRIICVSDCIKEITAPSIRNSEVLTTVHSGIDVNKFGHQNTGKLRSEYGIAEDVLLIGNIAALAPHKDYHTFVETVVRLNASGINAKYLIIGEGDERSAIEHQLDETGLTDRVVMTGFRKDIPEILPELDVFLITSETEGLGTSILDAMACRVPVVATRAGGIPEVVIHEQTGLLAKVKDADGLAQQVQRILDDETLRNQLVAGASEHLKNFSRQATARKTLEVYREILS